MRISILLLLGVTILALAPTATVADDLCKEHINLLFLVDKSESIRPEDWVMEKQFLKEMIETFWIGPKYTRVSLALFGNYVVNKFDFNKYHSKELLQKAIAEMTCPDCGNGLTVTGSVLKFGAERSLTSAAGASVGAKNVVIVITDGRSTESAELVKEKADLMKTLATVVAIGVGNIIREELAVIASSDDLVFTSNNFNGLEKLTKNIAGKTCEASTTAPTARCTARMNLLFVVDKSGSINANDWNLEKKYMKAMIDAFWISPTHTRVSVVLFGRLVRHKFDFNQYKSKDLLHKAVDALTCPKCSVGITAGGAALQFARDTGLSSENGASSGSKNLVVVITEGGFTESNDFLKLKAHMLKTKATVVAVGVGFAKRPELALLASSDDLTIFSNKFDKNRKIPQTTQDAICETVTNSVDASCTAPINLLFVVDKSGSINPTLLKLEKHFMKEMIDNFKISPTHTRVSVVMFGRHVRHKFDFHKYNSKDLLRKAVDDLTCLDCGHGKTSTGSALKYAHHTSLTSDLGARVGAQNVVVVITEGKGSESLAFLKTHAAMLKTVATVVTVGVGQFIKRNDLALIASSNNLVFDANDFGKLGKTITNVAEKTCEAANTAPVAICTTQINLLFVVDKSGSITPELWKREKQFLKHMIDNFMINPTHTRVSIVVFGRYVRQQFNFNQYSSSVLLKKAIDDLTCLDCKIGTTAGGEALKFARKKAFGSEFGTRVGAKNVVVVITEGDFTESNAFLMENKKLMKPVATVVAVGGGFAKRPELNLMARNEELVFISNENDDLEKLSKHVADKTCAASITAPVNLCSAHMNLVLVLDKSGSIRTDVWEQEKLGLKEMIDKFYINPAYTRVSIVLFGRYVRQQFNFIRYTSDYRLKKAVDDLTCPNCGVPGTVTGSAFKYVREKMFTSASGARVGANNVVVVITEGKGSESIVTEEVALLKKIATVVSIGVGWHPKRAELALLASSGDLVFTPKPNDIGIKAQLIADKICEAALTAPVMRCTSDLNLLFLVDKSESIGPEDWVLAKQGLGSVIDAFWISPKHTRVSIVLFGNHVRHKIDFNQYHSKDLLQKAVADLTCPNCGNGLTVTGSALKFGHETAFLPEHGAKAGTKNVIVVLTDGRSTEEPAFVKEHADLMKKVGTVVAVGVGFVKRAELEVIASSDSLVFTTENFDELADVTEFIAETTCAVGTVKPA